MVLSCCLMRLNTSTVCQAAQWSVGSRLWSQAAKHGAPSQQHCQEAANSRADHSRVVPSLSSTNIAMCNTGTTTQIKQTMQSDLFEIHELEKPVRSRGFHYAKTPNRRNPADLHRTGCPSNNALWNGLPEMLNRSISKQYATLPQLSWRYSNNVWKSRQNEDLWRVWSTIPNFHLWIKQESFGMYKYE